MNDQKVTLVICDGFGLSPESKGNAIFNAQTPTFDYLLQNYPAMRLLASGTEVGLDGGEPGNSEVGHLTLGTGQVLPQAFQIINASIKSEAYKKNENFLRALTNVTKHPGSTLHLIGMVSAGGVHGHIEHMIALLKLAKEHGVDNVAIHAITDGRDTPARVAIQDLEKLKPALTGLKQGVIATIGGRFYAMDRDANWERTDPFYWGMLGKAKWKAASVEDAIQQGYARKEGDETLQPTLITNADGEPLATLKANDTIIFTNYRPDRIRQLTTRVIMTDLPLTIVTMTNYFLADMPIRQDAKTEVINAYPLPRPQGTLSHVLNEHGKRQLHIAETEKYAHITYFFNGHEERKKANESWLLVPSVKIDSFDRAPEMSAHAITEAYMAAKKHHPPDFITINYANTDMVGHTGNFVATQVAVATVDTELKAVVEWCEQNDEWLLITADHGNAEEMINPITGEIDKEHSTNPVPLVVVHSSLKKERGMDKIQLAIMANVGILADVAPTILDIMGMKKSKEMVGTSLLPQVTQL